jgi:hypothetical protein
MRLIDTPKLLIKSNSSVNLPMKKSRELMGQFPKLFAVTLQA